MTRPHSNVKRNWTAPSGVPVPLRDWHLNVSQWGRWSHPPGYRHPAVTIAADMLVWTETGEATYFLGAEFFRVGPGTLTYLPAATPFFYVVAPGEPYCHCTLHFHFRNGSGVSLERLGAPPRTVRVPDPALAARLFEEASTHIGQPHLTAYVRVCSVLLQLLNIMLDAAFDRKAPASPPHGKAYEAMAIIEREFRTPLSVKELAARVRITPEHLAKVFSKTFHISPKLQISQLRLTLACSLLMTTDKGIKEVAYEVGFSSPNVFERAFREFFHCTPGELRVKRAPTSSGPTFAYRRKTT